MYHDLEIMPDKPLLTLDVYREELEDGEKGWLPDISDIWNARHKANPCQYVGITAKATDGVSYDTSWFHGFPQKMAAVAGDLYGHEWFWRGYHLARPNQDHRKQAEVFCKTLLAAGNVDHGMLCPWFDVEPPKAIHGTAKQFRDCAAVFAEVVAKELGRRITVYGGRQASIQLEIPRLGLPAGTRVCVAAYSKRMPVKSVLRAGWTIADVDDWQYTQGHDCFAVTTSGIKLPRVVPGVHHGGLDCSVFIGGGAPSPSLDDFIRRQVTDSII